MDVITRMEYEVIVGVSSKNCEQTIAKVTKACDKAFSELKVTGLILCVDGYSVDETKKVFLDTKTTCEKKAITEKGKKGKGSSVKTLLEKAKSLGPKAVVLVDGDFASITPEVIVKLAKPILKEKHDVIIPHYQRDKNDAVLSTHVVYPLLKSLFQSKIRNPLAGEYGLSRQACNQLLSSSFFPYDHGIDAFITITSLCEELSVAETKLGVKEHGSSVHYVRPEEQLMPRFNQVMKTIIQLMRYYKTHVIREVDPTVKKLGKSVKKKPKKVSVDIEAWSELSRNELENANDYALRVYEQLNKQNVMGLKVAWLNWMSIYFEKTKNMTNDKAEKEVEAMTKAFAKYRDVLRI